MEPVPDLNPEQRPAEPLFGLGPRSSEVIRSLTGLPGPRTHKLFTESEKNSQLIERSQRLLEKANRLVISTGDAEEALQMIDDFNEKNGTDLVLPPSREVLRRRLRGREAEQLRRAPRSLRPNITDSRDRFNEEDE